MVMAVTEAGPVERIITGTRPGKALAGEVASRILDEGVAVAASSTRTVSSCRSTFSGRSATIEPLRSVPATSTSKG